MMRFLQVFIGSKVAGVVSDQRGDWAFEYSNEWLQDPEAYPLSPALELRLELYQDTPFARPVQSFFENLLPHPSVQLQWTKAVRLPAGDTFGLLMLFGQECLGALQLLPATEKFSDTISVQEVAEADLQGWVLQQAQRPLASHLSKKMMLPLDDLVLPIIYFDQRFFEPIGQMVGTHWICFNQHPKPIVSPPSFAVNQWFCTRLASMVGLPAPEVQFHFGDIWMCVITRTDRLLVEEQWQRLPMIHAGQLLNLPPEKNLVACTHAQLLELCEYTSDPQETAESLYAWILFHLLIGSDGLQTTDLYFLLENNSVRLVPFLPLSSKSCYQTLVYSGHPWPNQQPLSLPIGSAQTWQELTLTQCYDFAETLGIDREQAKRISYRLVKKLMVSAQQLIAEFEQMFQDSEKSRELFTQSIPCEPESLSAAQQCMRAIQYGVLQTMIHQLVEQTD